MTNIEERAWEKYLPIKFDEGVADKDVILHNIRIEERRVGYIQGATEQKAIDIEVAVAWLRKYVRPYYKFSIEDFKKAMEE